MAIRLLASKRGIYFTVVSIVIISLLVGFSNFDDNTRIKKRGDMLSKRAISMNNFLEDVENDIERMILISGFRALLSVEKHITDTQGFVSDFEEVFSNIFINGSYNDTTYDLMNDASLTEWGDRIDEEANIINLNFEISPNRVWAEHDTPWSVVLYVNTTFYLSDYYQEISWNYTKVYSNKIPITDFEDPLYKVGTRDQVTNLIIKSSINDYINDSNNDTTNIQEHINNSYYVNSTGGPSFLMRFEGDLSNSTYGIESFINLEDFLRQNLEDLMFDDRSLIDYIYFNESSDTADNCDFDEGMQEWFSVDSAHLIRYELNKIDSSTSCP